MKKTQNGFIVPLLLAVIAFLLAGGGAYVYMQKKSENTPVLESATLPQATSTSLIKTQNQTDSSNPDAVIPTSGVIDKLKNATYHFILPSENPKGGAPDNDVTLKMVNGEARIGNDPLQFTAVCFFPKTEPVVFGQSGDSAVVAVYCNYGASLTDVFLVAFKNMSTTPTQTDITNLRSYPDSKISGSLHVSVKKIVLEATGSLSVTTLVVPESLRSQARAFQNNSELYTINYQLDEQDKFVTTINSYNRQVSEKTTVVGAVYNSVYMKDNGGKGEFLFTDNNSKIWTVNYSGTNFNEYSASTGKAQGTSGLLKTTLEDWLKIQKHVGDPVDLAGAPGTITITGIPSGDHFLIALNITIEGQ